MQAVNYFRARNNLKSIIDNVCDNNEEVIITTKDNKTVIILSMDEYNRTHEQVQKDVLEGLAQVEKGDLFDADDTFNVILAKYED